MVTHIEAGGSMRVRGQPNLQSEFQNSLGCYKEKPVLENENKKDVFDSPFLTWNSYILLGQAHRGWRVVVKVIGEDLAELKSFPMHHQTEVTPSDLHKSNAVQLGGGVKELGRVWGCGE